MLRRDFYRQKNTGESRLICYGALPGTSKFWQGLAINVTAPPAGQKILSEAVITVTAPRMQNVPNGNSVRFKILLLWPRVNLLVATQSLNCRLGYLILLHTPSVLTPSFSTSLPQEILTVTLRARLKAPEQNLPQTDVVTSTHFVQDP